MQKVPVLIKVQSGNEPSGGIRKAGRKMELIKGKELIEKVRVIEREKWEG